MTKQEFTKFKKEIRKEIEWFNGCPFYMNSRQEALHTATVELVADLPYEGEIEYHKKSIEKVNGYTSWTDEEKARHEAYLLKMIEKYQNRLNQFGTPANEAQYRFQQLKDSKAFQKLNGVEVELVYENRGYYGRFYY